jgi:hypothetical protein
MAWIGSYGLVGLFAVALAERFMPVILSLRAYHSVGIGAADGDWSLSATFLSTVAGSMFGCAAWFYAVRGLGASPRSDSHASRPACQVRSRRRRALPARSPHQAWAVRPATLAETEMVGSGAPSRLRSSSPLRSEGDRCARRRDVPPGSRRPIRPLCCAGSARTQHYASELRLAVERPRFVVALGLVGRRSGSRLAAPQCCRGSRHVNSVLLQQRQQMQRNGRDS